MNCNTCGTQLPQGAANCPQCGSTTPFAYSHASIAPNDPTVVSSSYTDAQQPPQPTMYGSSSYQNPYDPYEVATPAPPPPSAKGPGNRMGIIVGLVFFVLILIGGSVFAVFTYSSASDAAAANAHATATASASAAVKHFTAKGTFTILSRTNTSVRQDGQNKIYSYTQQMVDYGDITGSFTVEETSIVHPDNTANFSGTSTCTCTVDGKSGIYMWSYTGTSAANGSFQGQDFNGHGTGDLVKLHGEHGEFQGQGSHGNYSSDLYFDA